MTVCIRCGIKFSDLSWLNPFKRQTGRCRNCEAATRQALLAFREDFLRLSNDGEFTLQKLQKLEMRAKNDSIEIDEALDFIRNDALNLLERVLDAIIECDSFTDQLEDYFYQLQSMLSISDDEADDLLRKIDLLNIYRGKFPIVSQDEIQDIQLSPGEICYLITSTQYFKVNKASTKIISGRLIATNKKLRFLAETGGKEILWNSVMSIKRGSRTVKKHYGNSEISSSVGGIYLELNKKAGGGFYSVSDSEMVIAIIDALVRIAKGQLVKMVSNNKSLQLQELAGGLESEYEKGKRQHEEPERLSPQELTEMQVVELTSPQAKSQKAIEVFYSYTPKDEKLRKKLETQLSLLRQQGYITNWHNHKIDPGQDMASEINKHLNSADIILLLVSPDFLASDYCYGVEMKCALERHEARDVIVIPIILRPADWENAPFGKLKALPQDGRPVTSRSWGSQDEALLEVAKGIRQVVEQIRKIL
jgi:TIR domain